MIQQAEIPQQRSNVGAAIKGRLRQWRVSLFHRLLPGVALHRNLARTHERELELRVLPALADPARASIDVGANAGLYAAELVPLSAGVIAIEPHPRLARLLRALPRDKVEVHQAIASARGGETLELEVDLINHREADALGHVAASGPRTGARRFPTLTLTLDEFADQAVGLVKIDVEGHELEVLKGARKLIEGQRPVFLVEAEARHRDGAPQDLFEYFVKFDYVGFFLQGGKAHVSGEFRPSMQDLNLLIGYSVREESGYVNNFIFVPSERDPNSIMAACEKLLSVGCGDD